MNRPRVAVLVSALGLATTFAGCGGSGSRGPADASRTGVARGTAHGPTLAQVPHDLARLPAWQRKLMLKQWEILRGWDERGCPTDAQLHTLTVRLDAVAAGNGRGSVFVVGCRPAAHGG